MDKQCPVCQNEMFKNIEGKQRNAKAPDWKCSNPECKKKYDNKSKTWVDSDFRTGVWENTQNTANTSKTPNLTLKTPNLAPEKPNWDKISFGKCKYGFMIELIKKCDFFVEIDTKPILLDDIEKNAEELARRAMRVLNEPEVKQYTDNIEITEVPFN